MLFYKKQENKSGFGVSPHFSLKVTDYKNVIIINGCIPFSILNQCQFKPIFEINKTIPVLIFNTGFFQMTNINNFPGQALIKLFSDFLQFIQFQI